MSAILAGPFLLAWAVFAPLLWLLERTEAPDWDPGREEYERWMQ